VAILPFPLTRDRTALPAGRDLPSTWEEWRACYTRRDVAYHGGLYDAADRLAFQLFQARDDANDVIAETRRLTRDVAHVVDVNRHALAPESLTLTLTDAARNPDGDLVAAYRSIWKRSGFAAGFDTVAGQFAGLGRVGLAVRRLSQTPPYRSVLVPVDPRHYRAVYDPETGTQLERVIITIPFFDAATVDGAGRVTEDGTEHVWVQELTADTVTTWLDGVLQDDQTGDHRLGVVPFVNARYYQAGESEHGIWAAQGLDSALALYDSLQAQIAAIGTRYANPKLVIKGAEIGSSSELSLFGRVLNFFGIGSVDVVAEYLEPSLQQLGHLLESAREIRETAKETLPEFLVSGAGANASGRALEYRSAALVAKMGAARRRLWSETASALDMAQAMDAGAPVDPDTTVARITGGLVLPVDLKAHLEALGLAKALGVRQADIVRALQDLDLVADDADPEAYAAEILDGEADRATRFFVDRTRSAPALE